MISSVDVLELETSNITKFQIHLDLVFYLGRRA